jgi:hypothetical protein
LTVFGIRKEFKVTYSLTKKPFKRSCLLLYSFSVLVNPQQLCGRRLNLFALPQPLDRQCGHFKHRHSGQTATVATIDSTSAITTAIKLIRRGLFTTLAAAAINLPRWRQQQQHQQRQVQNDYYPPPVQNDYFPPPGSQNAL